MIRKIHTLSISILFIYIFFINVGFIFSQPIPEPSPLDSLTITIDPQIPDGIHTSYWPDNSLKAKGNVTKGMKTGNWNIYHQEGNGQKILATGSYKNDRKEGLWELFTLEGILAERIRYQNGQKEGEYWIYYPSGKAHFSFTCKGNKINGKGAEYDENGSPLEIAWYTDDKRNGMSNLFYPGGKKMAQGRYAMGIKSGKWSFYDESGRLKEKGEYQNGEKIGLWQTFDHTGKVIGETIF